MQRTLYIREMCSVGGLHFSATVDLTTMSSASPSSQLAAIQMLAEDFTKDVSAF